MGEVERAAAVGELPDVVIEDGELTISPLRRAVPEDAEYLKAKLYALLPRVRITDLLAEVAAWTGFADSFVHVRTSAPAADQPALMGAILADATNLGLPPARLPLRAPHSGPRRAPSVHPRRPWAVSDDPAVRRRADQRPRRR